MSHDERVTHPDQYDDTDAAISVAPDDARSRRMRVAGVAQAGHADDPHVRPSSQDRRQRRLRRSVVAGVALLVVALIVAVFTVPVNVVIEAPGPTWNVLDNGSSSSEDVLKVSGTETFPTEGALRMTTVSVSGCPGYPGDHRRPHHAWSRRQADRGPQRGVPRGPETPEQVEETGKAR